MRQLLIQVPRGCGKQVLEIAKDFDGANLALLEGTGSDGAIDLGIEIGQVIEASGTSKLVEANIRFTAPDIQGQNTLLGVVYVQRQPGVTASREEIRTSLTRAIQSRLLAQGFNVTPLIDVNVLEAPNEP